MNAALTHIHWSAVAIAAAAHFALGGAWFTLLVGRQYASALGIADRPPSRPEPLQLAGPLICGTVTVVATALLLGALGVTDLGTAASLGLAVGIGYLAPMTLNIAINPMFPHPLRYALLAAPMFVLGSVMSAVILAAMS